MSQPTPRDLKDQARQTLISTIAETLVVAVDNSQITMDPAERYPLAEAILNDLSTDVLTRMLSGMVGSDAPDS